MSGGMCTMFRSTQIWKSRKMLGDAVTYVWLSRINTLVLTRAARGWGVAFGNQ